MLVIEPCYLVGKRSPIAVNNVALAQNHFNP